MSAQAVRLTRIDIDNALQNAHLEIAFQPVIAFADRKVRRYEAFVRWEHPGLGPLPPGAFLSFFESQGRIGELTRYVLANTLAAAVGANLPDDIGVSINLSVGDLKDPDLPAAITAALKTYEWDASRLTLECPLFSPDVPLDRQAAAYEALAATGCALALEVRGRASDAMKGLKPFPFKELKTGGPAVLRQVRSSRGGPGLNTLSELLGFAKERGVQITAVGVEDHEAATALGSLGFDLGQGNALGRAGHLPGRSMATSDAAPAPVSAPESASGEAPLDLQTEEKETRAESHTRRARIAAAKRVAMRRLRAASEPAGDFGETSPEAIETARTLQSRLEQHFPTDPADDAVVKARLTPTNPAPAAKSAPEAEPTAVENLVAELPADLRPGTIAETAPTDLADTLKADCTDPADTLDEAVGELPVLPTDTADHVEPGMQDPLPDTDDAEDLLLREASEPPLWLHLLQRRYRITHFWPRSWRRWNRRRLAAQAERLAFAESTEDAVSSERREQDPIPVVTKREEHPLVFGPLADLR